MSNTKDAASNSKWRHVWSFWKKNYMTVNIVLALVAGMALGSFLVWVKPIWSPREVKQFL